MSVRARLLAAWCLGGLTCGGLMCGGLPAEASESVFHIFTPSVEAGAWGVEALSAFSTGLAASDEHAALRAAHELAIHTGVNDFWMAKLALGFEKPSGDEYAITSIALENVFRFNRAHAGAFDAAWFTAISAGIDDDASNAIEFGPVVSMSEGPVSLVLNPFLEKTFGDNREPGIAFSYGWRATYRIADTFSIGLEGYGAIEDIAHHSAFEEQIHRMGPVLYLGHVHGDAHGIHGAAHDAHGHDDEPEWHGEIGVLFGLTDATDDATIKFNAGADF